MPAIRRPCEGWWIRGQELFPRLIGSGIREIRVIRGKMDWGSENTERNLTADYADGADGNSLRSMRSLRLNLRGMAYVFPTFSAVETLT